MKRVGHLGYRLRRLPRLRVGRLLRLVLAILRNSLSLMLEAMEAMPREAPRSDDLDVFPRLAANAAPAAICCFFFDFAGMVSLTR